MGEERSREGRGEWREIGEVGLMMLDAEKYKQISYGEELGRLNEYKKQEQSK